MLQACPVPARMLQHHETPRVVTQPPLPLLPVADSGQRMSRLLRGSPSVGEEAQVCHKLWPCCALKQPARKMLICNHDPWIRCQSLLGPAGSSNTCKAMNVRRSRHFLAVGLRMQDSCIPNKHWQAPAGWCEAGTSQTSALFASISVTLVHVQDHIRQNIKIT